MKKVFLYLLLPVTFGGLLWSSTQLQKFASPETKKFSRIFTVPSIIIDTGLHLDEVVERMAFDSHGHLWLIAPEGGPYLYTVETNEVINLLRPDYVYNLFADRDGMWILSSFGAQLYRDQEIIRSVPFPAGVIPLSATRFQSTLYFGTTRGLYSLPDHSQRVILLGLEQERIIDMVGIAKALLLVTPNNIWRFRDPAFLQQSVPAKNILYLLQMNQRLYVVADSGLSYYEKEWVSVFFAKPGLTTIHSVIVSTGQIFLGTAEGSVLIHNGRNWLRTKVGNFPVSAIAIKNDEIYAWVNGKLVKAEISYEQKTQDSGKFLKGYPSNGSNNADQTLHF